MTDNQYFAKTWLNKIYVVTRNELATKEEIQAKALAAITNGATDYGKERVQSDSSNSQEQRQITYSMITIEVEKTKEKIAQLIRPRLDVINMIEDSTLRVILLERYINQKKWSEIEDKMSYSHTRIMEFHLKALDEVSQYIPKGEDN